MQADTEFLGLTDDDGGGRYRFTVTDHLARVDGRLYGGAAIAVSIATAELVSARPAVWMTTQFVSTAPLGAEVAVHAEVLAPGRRTNQVRVTGTDADGAVVFASLGATGHHRDGGLDVVCEHAPEVSPPQDAEVWPTPWHGLARLAGGGTPPPGTPKDVGFSTVIEIRGPEVLAHPDPGPGRLCLWMRRRDRQPITAAVAAFIADMVPLAIAEATQTLAIGTSLDNTIRVGDLTAGEWILLDLRAHQAAGDYGQGVAHIWSVDGRLLATASQSASMTKVPFPIPGRT